MHMDSVVNTVALPAAYAMHNNCKGKAVKYVPALTMCEIKTQLQGTATHKTQTQKPPS